MKWFKSRRRKCEEEAKQDPDYRPTKDLESTEKIEKSETPWTAIILIGVLVLIAIVCIIVICIFKNK